MSDDRKWALNHGKFTKLWKKAFLTFLPVTDLLMASAGALMTKLEFCTLYITGGHLQGANRLNLLGKTGILLVCSMSKMFATISALPAIFRTVWKPSSLFLPFVCGNEVVFFRLRFLICIGLVVLSLSFYRLKYFCFEIIEVRQLPIGIMHVWRQVGKWVGIVSRFVS